MREISLPISRTISISFKSSDITPDKAVDGKILLGGISGKDAELEFIIAGNNAGKVIYATSSIENMMEDVIVKYLFGAGVPENMTKQRAFFRNFIIQSSGFSFSFKKTLFIQVVKENDLIAPRDRSSLEGLLKRIMDYRNAFAHGDLIYNNSGIITVTYFQSELKCDGLTDAYWIRVEDDFKNCYSLVKSVVDGIGQLLMNDMAIDGRPE